MVNMENNDRIPLIALDYSQRHLAHRKEIMIDYNTGRIYVVSAKDKSVIFDITERILDQIATGIPGDSLVVTVEGVGTVNLKQFIINLRSNMLNANTFKGKHCVPSYAIDQQSIVNKDGIIQIYDYWKAEEDMIPMKKDGILRWDRVDALDPIVDKVPDGNYEVVLDAPRCKTTVTAGALVNLVTRSDKKNRRCKIEWVVLSGNTIPTIKIKDGINIFCEFEADFTMKANSMHVYTFETWDGGSIWFESVKKYGKYVTDAQITRDYLINNYYTKGEVEDRLKWKNAQGTNI